jgi:hypothetical protein
MSYQDSRLVYVPDPEAALPPWQALGGLPLLILVGLTGVGKSTLTDALADRLDFVLLPNRRQITDTMIITSLQQAAGEPVQPVVDRLKRLEYTARYRRQYPGGMAYALSRFAIDLEQAQLPLVFDGIRGLDEVQGAIDYFPHARFLILDAPDLVRLSRLLNRGDSFDQVSFKTVPDHSLVEALQLIPNFDSVFSEVDLEQISRSLTGVAVDEVVAKAALIVKERHNYDSQAAKAYLLNHLPSERTLVLDTSSTGPGDLARQIVEWLA